MNTEIADTETVGIFKNGKNKKVIELLKKQNKNVIEFPVIETEPLNFNDQQIKTFQNICRFDWLIFTDIFTVDYFVEGLEKTGFELYELDNFRICASGEAVADRLRFVQIHTDVIPSDHSAEQIVSGIRNYTFEDAKFFDSQILIIKAENKFIELSNLFEELKIKNEEIEVYRTLSNDNLENAKMKCSEY